MKKVLKFTAIILSLAMVIGCLPIMSIAAQEAESTLPTYNAFNEFSYDQNPNGVWSYESVVGNDVDGYTYTNLPKGDNVWGEWTDLGPIYLMADEVTSATPNALGFYPISHLKDLSVTFTAPYSGTIDVKMANGGAYAPTTPGDSKAARLVLKLNEKKLKVENFDGFNNHGDRAFDETVSIQVNAGDKLRFVVGRNVPQTVHVRMNPEITYTEIFKSKYNAFEDFSVEQNPNGAWSYESATGNETEGYTYSSLTLSGDSWGDAGTEGNISLGADQVISSDVNCLYLYPASGLRDTVLTFTAPKNGRITLNMANLAAYAPTTPGDTKGARLTLKLNDTTIRTENFDANNSHANRVFADTITLDVKAGDKVRFLAGRNIEHGVQIRFNPEINYVSFGEKTVFNAKEDFSFDQNPNGAWSYETAAGDEENGYTFAKLSKGEGLWGNYDPDGVIHLIADQVISADVNCLYFYPASHVKDAVLTFTAPYTGTVDVRMANGAIFAPTTANGTKAARFVLRHNDKTLRIENFDADNSHADRIFTDTMTINVKAGDTLHFMVRRNVVVGVDVRMNPEIKYTSIEEETGRTFYVDNVYGSDAYAGTSEYAPWQTLAKLANIKFKAGDKILLKSGSVWNEQLVLNNVSATKEKPIVISSYGEGDQPKIDLAITDDPATDIYETAKPVVLINNAAGLEINNLYITGSGIGIDLHYDHSYNNEYVKISNCYFKGLTGFGQYENQAGLTDRYGFAGAICVTRKSYTLGITDPSIIGLFVDNCTTNGCGSLMTYAASPDNIDETRGSIINGLFITNSTMLRNDYYGTFIGANGYMANCLIKDCGQAERFASGSAGIMISANDFAVINTEISGQQQAGVNVDGCAIDFEHLCENVTIDNCYIHDNTGVGVMFYDSGNVNNGANKNCTVKNTVFANNASASPTSNFPRTDIWVAFGYYYALENGTIKDNRYYNYNDDYSFFVESDNPHAPGNRPQVEPVVENNSAFDPMTEFLSFLQDKTTVLDSYKAVYADYNLSDYTADLRTGSSFDGGVNGDVYSFATEFSENMANWDCLYWDAVNGLTEMTWNSENNQYNFDIGGIVGADFVHPSIKYGPIIAFTAPKAGRVRIDLEQILAVQDGTVDGTCISVLDNNLNLVCDPIHLNGQNNNVDFGEVYLKVAAGDKIYFSISKGASNQADVTFIKPRVTFVNAFASLNGDENIDMLDLIKLKKYQLDAVNAEEADIDGSGNVDSIDLILLKKYLFGMF